MLLKTFLKRIFNEMGYAHNIMLNGKKQGTTQNMTSRGLVKDSGRKPTKMLTGLKSRLWDCG